MKTERLKSVISQTLEGSEGQGSLYVALHGFIKREWTVVLKTFIHLLKNNCNFQLYTFRVHAQRLNWVRLFSDPMDCSPQALLPIGFSHQERGRLSISFCRRSSPFRDLISVSFVSCIGRWSDFFTFHVRPKSSVQFSHSAVSDSLWPHGLQQSRLPCPLTTPGAYLYSCPLSRWCHPTISFSVVPFSSCLKSFPSSGSFPMSQFFASGGQSIGISVLASVLPMNIQDWFPLGLIGWISL